MSNIECPRQIGDDLASRPGLTEAAGSVDTTSTSAAPGQCLCDVISADVQMCVEHHRYWLNGQRLHGVTSVIKDVLPPDYSKVSPEVLENARDRGNEVDALVALYVVGKLQAYPAGTREDVIPLFEKFQNWWDKQRFRKVEAQALVTNKVDIAGLIDIRTDGDKFNGDIWDVKATSDIMPSHHWQMAGYGELNDGGRARLIHVTKRNKSAKIVDVVPTAYDEWKTIRDFWRLKRKHA